MAKTFNILMYSHDTYGLGHIRRTMAIACHLLGPGEPDVNVLILTGSPIVGRFDFPQGIDFVRVPGMIKKTNDVYLPHSIKVETRHAMNIRRNIITATAKAFKPSLFIVDKAPTGLKKEILPTLKWFKNHSPGTKVILGLRDIMDDAESTIRDWEEKRVYSILEKLYSEIWIYGDPEIYDPRVEYAIPESIREKTVFTGYIPRFEPTERMRQRKRKELGVKDNEKLVVVTTGGGGDGCPVLEAYLRLLETHGPRVNGDQPFKTVMVSGPFVPKGLRDDYIKRSRKLGVRFHTFYKPIERLMAAADLVVSMGGYNTVCELLTVKRAALIIPRDTPRLEQTLRAQALSKKGLIEYLPWGELSPDAIHAKLLPMLENPAPYEAAMQAFSMPGLDVMRERLLTFKGEMGYEIGPHERLDPSLLMGRECVR